MIVGAMFLLAVGLFVKTLIMGLQAEREEQRLADVEAELDALGWERAPDSLEQLP